MVDFHSHVLPAMDDGARDVSMALAMLEQAGRQGVKTVVATPHFYLWDDTPERFFTRRQHCYEQLSAQLTPVHPQVRLGAEVLAWEGMSRTDLRPFCIEGTDTLLVEFPFARMPHWLVEELENIILVQGLTVVLAHLERYMHWYSKEDVLALSELPDVVVQLGCDSLTDWAQLHRIVKWLPSPERLVLGTDMHNTTNRKPQMDAALHMLVHHRIGRYWLACMEETIPTLL